jgi:hypothetical protein
MTGGTAVSMKKSKWLVWSLPALLLATGELAAARTPATPAGGAGGTGETDAMASNASAADTLDPVVREVVQMLAAKVPEPVILRWLGQTGRRPAALGSADLIALKSAGASEALLDKLLELAGPPPPAANPAAGAPAATPAPAPAPAPAGEIRVHFNVEYRPYFGEDEEVWNLFVYLDGRYLASVKPAVVAQMTRPLEFDRTLAPGRHFLRLIEERHLEHPLDHGWQHQARVAPAELPFELRPGAAATIDVGLHEMTLRRRPSPLSLTVAQGDATPAGLSPAVPPANRWPLLCEEVETSDRPGHAPSAATRRQLEHCLRWVDLWPGTPDLASRDQVRASLERLRFKPGPAAD